MMGYGHERATEISRVLLSNEFLLVYADEYRLGPGKILLEVVTHPGQAVSLPILDSDFTASFIHTAHVVS